MLDLAVMENFILLQTAYPKKYVCVYLQVFWCVEFILNNHKSKSVVFASE